MYIIINKELLVSALQTVAGPTTTKQNFPILGGVKLETIKNKVKFTATDLDITIITYRDAEIKKNGEFVIPMRRLLSIAKELPPHDVSLEIVKNNLLITCGKVEFKVTTLTVEEFPQSQEPKKTSLIKIDAAVLEEMIRMTSFSVGFEDVNYVLNGILFEIIDDTISLVSTDGKRLSYIKRPLTADQPPVTTKLSFILPIKVIYELQRLVKDNTNELYFSVEDNRVGFDFKETQLIARPIEGEFPGYGQYIPGESKEKLTVNKAEFLSGLKRANLLSAPEYQGVKLEIKKTEVVISKNTPQLGEVKEILEGSYSGTGLEIGFNPSYLIDVLKNIEDEEITFEFNGPDKPAVIRKHGYIYLLLPMKT